MLLVAQSGALKSFIYCNKLVFFIIKRYLYMRMDTTEQAAPSHTIPTPAATTTFLMQFPTKEAT